VLPDSDVAPDRLLEQARAGDVEARGRLLELYRNYLCLLARSLLGQALRARLDPSDLVQETYLKAHRDFAGFLGSSEAELVGWLRTLLVRSLANQAKHHRAQRRDLRRQESLEAMLDRSSLAVQQALAAPVGSSPSARAARREQTVLLADAVAKLPDDYREVFLLRNEAGCPADPEGLVAAHPHLAGPLRACLDMMRLTQRLTAEAGQGPRFGDFRIIREIGRGGMGVVYEAEQESLGRRVALKVLPLGLALDPRQLRRFQVEAHAAACLHHTNIVPIYAIGCEQGVPYYTMPLIEGRDLAQLIRELRVLDQHGSEVPAGEAELARWPPRCRRDGWARRRGTPPPRRTSAARQETPPRRRCPCPRRWPRRRRATGPTPARWLGWPSRRPRRWSTRMAAGSCTATSSRPTSCSTPKGPSGTPTSGSPASPAKTARRPPATCLALCAT
jgi:RNA polymerase sigma-70 factor (ECF subfamily)